jgi:hypothetical protein
VFVFIFGLVVLIFCWANGDVQLTTKIVFTLLYLASFGLIFIPNMSYLFIVAQCGFIAMVGATTFGLDWLSRNVR